MTDIAARLATVHHRIAAAATAAGRDPDDITLLAVSKAQSPGAVAAAAAAGQRAFGENYLDEALTKFGAAPGLTWHFIGRVQSNKTRAIAERFDWVQTISTTRIAHRLSSQRPATLPPLSVCIQVNVSGEERKGGIDPDGLPALAEAVASLPRLHLRGLMTIPAPGDVAAFERMRALQDDLVARGHALDTLSMGMSMDLDAAIAGGATMVRVGTAIFGER